MGMEAPAVPGMAVDDIDTPALVIDLDAFERNLKRMADAVAGTDAKLRPHAKTHKCPEIAKRQIAYIAHVMLDRLRLARQQIAGNNVVAGAMKRLADHAAKFAAYQYPHQSLPQCSSA